MTWVPSSPVIDTVVSKVPAVVGSKRRLISLDWRNPKVIGVCTWDAYGNEKGAPPAKVRSVTVQEVRPA